MALRRSRLLPEAVESRLTGLALGPIGVEREMHHERQTSAIARRMGISMSNASNLRRRLIERGAITELRHGVVDFDVPMTREYLRALKG